MTDKWFGMEPRIAAWLWIAILSCCGGAIAADEPRAFEGQTREFKVSVDGKERGKCTMRIDRRDDGADRLRVDSQLRFNYVVYEYKYASTGVEVWKEGRLVELDNTSDYNGTRYMVKAAPGAKGLRVTINGKGSQADLDAWVTSYWQLPERLATPDTTEHEGVVPAAGRRPLTKAKSQTVPLLDSDQGKALRGELLYVGEETVTVAGKRKSAKHYRVSGDVQADLWYDATLRLVRQESVDQGHKTTLELIGISDNSKPQRP